MVLGCLIVVAPWGRFWLFAWCFCFLSYAKGTDHQLCLLTAMTGQAGATASLRGSLWKGSSCCRRRRRQVRMSGLWLRRAAAGAPAIALLLLLHLVTDLQTHRRSPYSNFTSRSAHFAGEYLCPICRRLGNCLLPAAAAPQADSSPQAAEQPAAPLTSADALAQLQQLLQAGPDNWAAAAATSSGELRQRWQEVQAQGGAGPGVDVSLQLVPRFGSQAARVVALAQDARTAASKWLSQQHRALDWLQHRGAPEW